MAERSGHAVLVGDVEVQNPCFLEIGERLTGTSRPQVGHADLIEGVGLAAPVGQRPVDRRGVLGQWQGHLEPARLLAYLTEFQCGLGGPGRVGDVTEACRARLWAAIASSQYALISTKPASAWMSRALLFHSCWPAYCAACRMLCHSDSSQAAASCWVPSAGPRPLGGNRYRRPPSERKKDLVSLVGGVQVVVEQPADGLSLLRPGSSRAARTAA